MSEAFMCKFPLMKTAKTPFYISDTVLAAARVFTNIVLCNLQLVPLEKLISTAFMAPTEHLSSNLGPQHCTATQLWLIMSFPFLAYHLTRHWHNS